MKKHLSVWFLSLLLISCNSDDRDLGLSETSTSTGVSEVSGFSLEDIKMCTEMDSDSRIQPKGAVLISNKWKPGEVIKVKFLNGDAYVQGKVRKYITEWLSYANVKIQYVAANQNADIKIAFKWNGDSGSWSYLGAYSRNIAQNKPSMNFGWFDSKTTESEFSRTTLHEFGHALGLIHEHQHPTNTIPWNKSAVYAYYKKTIGWDAITVDNNIFAKYSKTQTNYSAYDKSSIMHYSIDKSLTLNGYSVGWNTTLSSTDKSFIAKEYPFLSNTKGFYRYYLNNGHHFYTSNFNELGNNYFEHTMGRVYSKQVANTFPIYRYYNKVNGDRLSTLNYNELKGGGGAWNYEGISGYAFKTPQANTIPVYRYYRSTAPISHFLTVSSTEVANGKHGFKPEGIAFYILRP